ncbi:MAG: hypothetical protein WC869_10565 [Phycisphaerae bacterium]
MDLSVISLIVSGIGVIASFIAAWIFGNTAGQKAAERFARKQEKERAVRILIALELAVAQAKQAAKHNAEIAKPEESINVPRDFIEFRLSPFDVVFSGEIGLPREIIAALEGFISQAGRINSSICAFNTIIPEVLKSTSMGGPPLDVATGYLKIIRSYCAGDPEKTRIPQLLAELERLISEELAAKRAEA